MARECPAGATRRNSCYVLLLTLLSFPAGMQTQYYDMTPQGQAIGVSGPAQPKGPWMIWRWSGGAPVKIATLPPLGGSPYYGFGAIAW
jgi:hypothetical protein